MDMHRRTLTAALAATALPQLARRAHAQAPVTLLARFPNGTFLENLVVGGDGSVLFTNYFARAIERYVPAGAATRFSEVDGHPVSLAPLDGGRHALVTHGVPFTRGGAAMRGAAAVLLVGSDGATEGRIPLPGAVFPNGILALDPRTLLIADSALGQVWVLDLGTGAVAPWLAHPLLAPAEGRPHPGVNGIKRAGEWLLLSNSAQRLLLRVSLTGGAGTLSQVAAMATGIDDFAIADGGAVYAATHAEGIALLRPGAAAAALLPAPGVEGSTAVALTPDGRALYALGTGGLFSGGKGEAVLARIPLQVG